MILLDAQALISLLLDEVAAAEVQSLLEAGDCGVAAPNLAEVIDVLGRRGVNVAYLRETLEALIASALPVVALQAHQAWRAGELRARYYHRVERPVLLADCLMLACLSGDDALATADPHVAAVARAEGLVLHALPDSAGRRP